MLNSSARAHRSTNRNAVLPPSHSNVYRLPHRPSARSFLECYLEGWAEANLVKIITATAPGYSFCDPLIGDFSCWTLHDYFDALRKRLSVSGEIQKTDLAFSLQGPIDRSPDGVIRFWREAPRIGLTGISEIHVSERGVVAERVAYDLNLASDLLRSAA